MPAHTTLLEFQFKNGPSKDAGHIDYLIQELEKSLTEEGFNKVYSSKCDGDASQDRHVHLVHSQGCFASIHFYNQGLLTVDIQEYTLEGKGSQRSQQWAEDLKENVLQKFPKAKSIVLPAIRRGAEVQCYFPTVDRKLIEYDFDRCVFEEDSKYQNVKIMHSPQFGNMLILDDDPNLAESDILYTHAITGHGREDYKDKTVLILGGGDGGILHELLKQKPKYVTMVDIDEVVVREAKKHLRGICYDSLDSLKGDNYEVLIEDCVPILQAYGEEGRVFDYVINDLTAIPVTTKPIGDQWDFMRLILDLSMKVLSPEGKYYTQGNGSNMPGALKMYEEQLMQLAVPVKFSKQNVFVPSYHEQWVFYEVWKNPVTNGTNHGS